MGESDSPSGRRSPLRKGLWESLNTAAGTHPRQGYTEAARENGHGRDRPGPEVRFEQCSSSAKADARLRIFSTSGSGLRTPFINRIRGFP